MSALRTPRAPLAGRPASRLVVATEARLWRAPGGALHSADRVHGYAFWARYREVFDEVVVVARAFDVADPGDSPAVAGDGVRVHALPGYAGASGLAGALPALLRSLHRAAGLRAAVLVRLPGPIGGLLARHARWRRRAYGVEVVGDPRDVFAPGVVQHPLRPLLRAYLARDLAACCARAAAVSYVSGVRLPERYPAAPGAPVAVYSSIDLDDAAFAGAPRPVAGAALARPRLVTVGSLAQRYKGVDTAIEAVALCCARGLAPTLDVVGDGRHRGELEALASRLGVADRVRFRGQVPAGEPVRRALDAADLFVLPSRTEGLPRAAIEAMARGLPVIGSDAGGFPELLPPADMVRPGDARALADAIDRAARSPARLAEMSARNLGVARRYRRELLGERRRRFYRALRDLSAARP